MHVLVIGAAGMVGRKLVEKLASDQSVFGFEVTRLTLADAFEPPVPPALRGVATALTMDLAKPGEPEKLIAGRPDVIFHLAAIVSGEAEADFEKGYAVNLDGSRMLFEAIRHEGLREPYMPRVIFASSIAVFGQPFPEKIGDEFFTTPLTSYGRRRSPSFCWPITPARASSTASASACRRSASVRANRTRRRPASSPTSCASRWSARKPCCRSMRTCATGSQARVPPSASSFMPRGWIRVASAHAAT
jgi:NAD(P)-dependent dehydrogenase (short-subunit alcohol dehydrogenase family)